jgi:hypothetical protein
MYSSNFSKRRFVSQQRGDISRSAIVESRIHRWFPAVVIIPQKN